jgi:hypothetical protein
MSYLGKVPAAAPIDASDIPDNSITSAKIVDGAIAVADIADDAVGIGELSATGTASATTFLRGDNSWVVPTDTTYSTGSGLSTSGTAFSLDLTADQSWTGSQRATLIVDNDGSFDMNGGNNFKCTPAGNFTLTFTNITDGQSGFILLVNTGGHTVSAHANSKVDASLLATVTAAGTYLVSYLSDGTNVYLTNSAIYT